MLRLPKYLLLSASPIVNHDSAILFLSELLGLKITDIDFLVREQSRELEQRGIIVYRLDFSARIQTPDGSFRQVIIELQKAKFLTDILRFRKYLGEEYSSRAHVKKDEKGKHHALPIIRAYILGYPLEKVKSPVVKVDRRILDLTTGKELKCEEEYIESLTHDCYIIQVKRLRRPYRSNLEKLLSIFDQELAVKDKHVLELDDSAYSEASVRLLRRLHMAWAEREVRETMDVEEDMLEELETRERQLQDRDEVIKKQGKALEEKDKALEEKDKALEEKDNALEEQGQALEEKERALEEQARLIEELQRKPKDS